LKKALWYLQHHINQLENKWMYWVCSMGWVVAK
jgi:hypothetical protein